MASRQHGGSSARGREPHVDSGPSALALVRVGCHSYEPTSRRRPRLMVDSAWLMAWTAPAYGRVAVEAPVR